MLAVAAVALLPLAGCTAPEPEPEELTVTGAGARYLDAVCPVNGAWDSVDVEVERLRIALARSEAGDETALGAALTTLERRSLAAAENLDDASVSWPADAEDAIAAVRDSLAADAEQARDVAELSAADAVAHEWEGAERIAATSAKARASLGLPDDPEVACEAR
ncbi:hypothetical protein SD72_04845 [Leucobacter komagatae]|uniref:Uncharacterized protein n=2 Tax=Leucobacter komagatae TaxID=55969 RepID=A0A0D0IUD4_9MICO|nr:hypothetical protein SD72_04845 [Leucobacter komagatae]